MVEGESGIKHLEQAQKPLEQALRTCGFCKTGKIPQINGESLPAYQLQQPKMPHQPRPVFQFSSKAKICIAGQAPGNLAHQSGRPFSDPSGVRLRQWLGVSEDEFYNFENFAIIPMGFCFPGYVDENKRGDLPPRKECATLWRKKIFDAHPQLELILTIGQYAQEWHLGSLRAKTLTQTVKQWRDYLDLTPAVIALPHPSWRNTAWLKRNPWFEAEIIPYMQEKISNFIKN